MAETRNETAQDGADLAAAARDRGTEQLEGDGDDAIAGFGRSVTSLMRQLAGGLRERDIEELAQELGALARRNPGVFLAGSVALGFGIARFFKGRASHEGGSERSAAGVGAPQGAASEQATSRGDERNPPKSRQSSKHKVKPQRASSGGTQRTGEGSHAPSTERPPTDPASTSETAGSSDSAFTGGTGGAPRGGKS